MRETLHWDVLFVIEHDDLRRAPDRRHFVLARQLGRTLVTLDRDYLDDRCYPPAETERAHRALRADRTAARADAAADRRAHLQGRASARARLPAAAARDASCVADPEWVDA